MLTSKEMLLLIAVIAVYGGIRLLPRLLAGAGAFLSVERAREQSERDDVTLLDVRSALEFAAQPGHIPGAVNIPLPQLRHRLADGSALPDDRARTVIVICQTDSRAAYAVRLLRRYGVHRAYVLGGGMNAWEQAGYPIESVPWRGQ